MIFARGLLKITFLSYFCCGIEMNILKFIKSFHTVNTYLALSVFLLVTLIVYFYHINPGN